MRNTVINLRVRVEQLDLIDCAAHALGKNRSDFMIEAAFEKARWVMFDQVFFSLGAKNYRDFRELLYATPSANPALERLLATVSPWETAKSR